MDSVSVVPILTPHSRLCLIAEDDAPALDPELAQRLRPGEHESVVAADGHSAETSKLLLQKQIEFWRGTGARGGLAENSRPPPA
jgi:hypothetical protein